MEKAKTVVCGFDVGGAHLKVARIEDGRVAAAATYAMPLWQGLGTLDAAFRAAAPLSDGSSLAAFTMTGELADVFPSRGEGVLALLDAIARQPVAADKLVYAGRAGLVGFEHARRLGEDIASANWYATAALVAQALGSAMLVDMGSTTTDIIPVRDGKIANSGYSDAERLASGELVYTGFTRTFLFGIASLAPVDGRPTPLMNEYFASMADAHRILGVLDEADDQHPAADGKDKTVAGSMVRLARMVGRDAAELDARAWRDMARWFSEQQLRTVHDAAFRVAASLADDAPIVGAGTGRWQIARLAGRMQRRFIDLADIIPAEDRVRSAASNAAPASAVALLAIAPP